MISAQENFELTTLRIGAYKIFMKADDAEKLDQKKLQFFEEWQKNNAKKSDKLSFINIKK